MIGYKINFLLISKQKKIFHQLLKVKVKSGRNNTGRITLRSRGGKPLRKKVRILDYIRALWNIPGLVKRFEYDNNRNTLVCLISYFSGIISFIIANEGLKIGAIIFTGPNALVTNIGNCTFLKNFSINSFISNLECNLYNGAQFLRASGSFGKLIKKNFYFVLIKLKSGKIKRLNLYCIATVGMILNFNFYLFRYKKAGLNMWKNRKPLVRGVAKNPIDHPYGGGEGKKSKKSICMSPWGKLIKGKKTRKNAFNLKRYLYG